MLSIIRLRVVQFLAVVTAAAAAPAAPPPHAVTDDLGATVQVRAAPLRIISLAPGATEMLFAAGAGAQRVAAAKESEERRAARAVARMGDVAAIDMERLVALKPDVVITWPAGGNPAQRDKIAALGIVLYQQQVLKFADLAPSPRRLGALTRP